MSRLLLVLALLLVVPTAAEAKAPRHLKLKKLNELPTALAPGDALRVRGQVKKTSRRRVPNYRLSFSLRTAEGAEQGWHLKSVKRRKRGRVRGFSVGVTMPDRIDDGAYRLRACVRKVPHAVRRSCKSRPITLAGRPSPRPGPPVQIGDPFSPLRSLRAAETDQNFYFVMADRFANGTTANDTGGISGDRLDNGYDPEHRGFYHGGDLQGMLEKIDYIRGLGTTAIWLTPSFKNRPVQGPPGQETAGYHGYWITDFTQIDPHLGSNDDLRALIDAAHDRGMKVYFDIITNHTADVIDYEEGVYDYVPKDAEPYRRGDDGQPFDDRDYAGTGTFPPLDADTSFPYTPFFRSQADAEVKVPDWLDDPTLYHNRGNTNFEGMENPQYGDFFGLDDLFTEHPVVVDGMIDIYKAWIRDFGVDGFRIDTMKHVDDQFWQRFAPEVLAYARAQGKSEFFMFGEVFDTTKTYTSHFTTHDRVQAVIDFPFQAAAQGFAANSGSTDALRDFFRGDDWYTDADSNVYQLPTFLGNHDMGRIGLFIRQANPGAGDEEVLARDRLAHELMYFSRGNPVVYYGDEQGFVGDGNDQLARQDMFPSQVDEYNDDDNIGTEETPEDDNFDADHPLYQTIAGLAGVAAEHPALRDGVQQHRYSSGGAGIYAFSRLDRDTQHEYVVALNNAESAQEASIPTAAGPDAAFELVYPDGGAPAAVTDAGGRLPVGVDGLSTVVYRSVEPIPQSDSAPQVSVAAAPDGAPRDRVEVRAFVAGESFYDVTFYARVGTGDWAPIGTDDNSPYRVFHDVAALEPGTPVRYRAVVLDNAGNVSRSDTYGIRVAEPSITVTDPRSAVRGSARVRAEATPDQNDYSVAFFRRIEDGAWTSVGTDSSQPSPYEVTDDLPDDLAEGTTVHYRAVLTYAPGRTVTSATRATTIAPEITEATVHYCRPGGDYGDPPEDGWGLHLWGGAKEGPDTEWTDPRPRDDVDEDGARFDIPLADASQPLNFIVHLPGRDDVPTGREPGGDRSFVPAEHDEIWLQQGDETIQFTDPGTCHT